MCGNDFIMIEISLFMAKRGYLEDALAGSTKFQRMHKHSRLTGEDALDKA